MNENSTSEVGFTQDSLQVSSEEKWRALFEQQNRSFLVLVEAMKPSSGVDMYLPEFNPDVENADARAWVAMADMCIAEKSPRKASLMNILSRALKGQASVWLAQVSYPEMTWTEFKDIFSARYDCPETAAAFLMNLNNNRPKEGECLSAYAVTMITSLMARWKNLTTEQIAVSTVFAHISQFEPRVHRLTFTADIGTRNLLQQELKAMSFLKKKAVTQNEMSGPDTKRYKASTSLSSIQCFNCGKSGHKALHCRFKNISTHVSNLSNNNNLKKLVKPNVTCFNCQDTGHYASSCPKIIRKNNGDSGGISSTDRRVDLCVIGTPAGSLNHSGEKFIFFMILVQKFR